MTCIMTPVTEDTVTNHQIATELTKVCRKHVVGVGLFVSKFARLTAI